MHGSSAVYSWLCTESTPSPKKQSWVETSDPELISGDADGVLVSGETLGDFVGTPTIGDIVGTATIGEDVGGDVISEIVRVKQHGAKLP